MPKRKREGAAMAASRRERDVEEAIVQGRKLLNKALKLARSFERQKLDKRIKLADKEGEGKSARLKKEMETLRALDISKVIDAHLFRTFLRTKTIAESNLLPGYVTLDVRNEVAPGKDALAVGNVTARLYNTKHVKEAMAQIMRTMYAAVGADLGRKSNGKQTVPPDVETSKDAISREAELWSGESSDGGVEIDGEGGEEEVEAAWNGFDSGSAASTDEEEISKYEARLGESSEEEDDDDDASGEAADWDKIRKSAGVKLNQDHSHDGPVFSPSRSPSPPPPSPPKLKPKKAAAPPAKAGSQFLPTLMGGYWSGSEESASDLEDMAPRKNRRGQRERRLIAERKFGKSAVHIKKGLPSVQDRDADWDPKRGARDTDERRGGMRNRGRRQGYSKPVRVAATGENAVEVGARKAASRKKDDSGILHPSWAAAKKAKEEKKAASFAGKKVVFD